VVLLDQAGWHMSAKLEVPDNLTLLPLPPRSPELNPQENVWQFLATIRSYTGSSTLTTTSLLIAAKPGTSSSNNPGASCQSAWVLMNERWIGIHSGNNVSS